MKAYDLRSDLVHGEAINPRIQVGGKEIAFGAFVMEVEERLRLVLCEILKSEAKIA
jgi:hypothetical protein